MPEGSMSNIKPYAFDWGKCMAHVNRDLEIYIRGRMSRAQDYFLSKHLREAVEDRRPR